VRLVAFLAALLLAGGCDEFDTRPDPPAVAEIELTVDGGYRLDGRVVTEEQLDRGLSRRVADAPNEKLGRTRLQVVIRHAPGINYERVLAVQERCQGLGISKIEVSR
jgi:biopolymer transport protein ExbD